MGVNLDKPQRWKDDTRQSVDMYNTWFLDFAPTTFRETRIETTEAVKRTLTATNNLTDIKPETLRANPRVIQALRMSTCPPLAVDRLIGLTGVSDNLVKCMEKGEFPVRTNAATVQLDLERIGNLIERLADPDIFVWLEKRRDPSYTGPTEADLYRAATIVADRLCGSLANPIIRNAQEKRQLAILKKWLEERGYRESTERTSIRFTELQPGTFSFRLNVPVTKEGGNKPVNIPIDAVIMPRNGGSGTYPLLVEAKSAGDFANVNKRRKEEAQKVTQLRATYGEENVRFVLLLCGYFDSPYLGYEAAEGIDWVWEHRLDDFAEFGL